MEANILKVGELVAIIKPPPRMLHRWKNLTMYYWSTAMDKYVGSIDRISSIRRSTTSNPLNTQVRLEKNDYVWPVVALIQVDMETAKERLFPSEKPVKMLFPVIRI